MSASDHPASRPALFEPHGSSGRSARPLFFLIPIAVGVALCLTLFFAGLGFLDTPWPSTAPVAQNAGASAGAAGNPAVGPEGANGSAG